MKNILKIVKQLKLDLEYEREAHKKTEELLSARSKNLLSTVEKFVHQMEEKNAKSSILEFLSKVSLLGSDEKEEEEIVQDFVKGLNSICEFYGYVIWQNVKGSSFNSKFVFVSKESEIDKSKVWSKVGEQREFNLAEGNVLFQNLTDKTCDAFRSRYSAVGAVAVTQLNVVIAGKEKYIIELLHSRLKESFTSLSEGMLTAVTILGNLLERAQHLKEIQGNLNSLKSAQDQLVQSEKMASLGTLVAGIAHEINNPLSYVLTNTECISEYLTSLIEIVKAMDSVGKANGSEAQVKAAIKKFIEVREAENFEYIRTDALRICEETIDGVVRVRDIINGLKGFSRADIGHAKITNINDCVAASLRILKNEIKYTCKIELNLSEVPSILGYSGQLTQVLTNLILNAMQAIQNKGTITITSRGTDKEITISVKDTGPGISEESMGKLFSPFYTTKPIGEGTGLGLSVSYGIIKKHGGKIEVVSKLGKGSEFTIKLPVKFLAESTDQEAA